MKRSIHAKRMARNHRKRRQSKLNLVSLMDIFTILVFFLLVNSSEVEVLENNKSIQLPESIAEKKPDDQLMVLVSKNNILVNGRNIVALDDIRKSDDNMIAELKTELEYQAGRSALITEQQQELGRAVTIMGDKSIPYTLLKKIMATCAETDFRNISLAVSQVIKSDAEINEAGE